MALSMSIPMELNDALDYCNYADQDYPSDLTDTENDEELYAFTPRAFERTVPRSSKRTYGLFLDSDAVPERRLRSKINEQLELLRAVLPNSCTDEKASILTGAYEYIETLQRQVQELHYELEAESCCDDDLSSCDDDLSSCEDDFCPSCTGEERPVDSNAVEEASCTSYCGCSQPTVDVVRSDKGLKIHIECHKKPGLLVEIMELLETCGLNVEQASIACQEHLVFDGIGSEVEGNDATNCKLSSVSAEEVQAGLRLLIAEQRLATPV